MAGQACLLQSLESTLEDVRALTAILHKYTADLSQQLPLVVRLRESNHTVFQQLGHGQDGYKLLMGDREMWGQISHGTQEHYNSLLATHQLLVAVSDLCQQAAATLASASQHLQPLLLSTGRDILECFMTLFCDTVRMALLIDEVPRKELPNIIFACHHVLKDLPGSPPPALPNTDIPIYLADTMTSFMQHTYQPLAPRMQQIVELSLTPALISLFTPGGPDSVSPPTSAGATTAPARPPAPAPAALTTLPPVFTLLPVPTDGGSAVPAKQVLMGPGGLPVSSAHALCIRFEALTNWLMLTHLVCPASLAHPEARSVLLQLLRTEMRLVLHKDRVCAIGRLMESMLAPNAAVPQYSAMAARVGACGPMAQVVFRDSGVQREVYTAVKAAVAWAEGNAHSAQHALRLRCIQTLQTITAACKAEPALLCHNLVLIVALLSLCKHTCLWWFRHCDTWGHSDARTPQHHTRTKAFSSGGGHRGSNAGSTRYSGGGAGRAAGSDAPLTAARSANSASNVGHAGPQLPRRGPVPAASAAAPLRGRSILSGGVSTGCESVGVGGVSECVNEGVLSERRLSVLELLGCMGQLVSLLDEHVPSIVTHVRSHVLGLAKAHMTPGHVRLATTGVMTAPRSVTLADTRRLAALVTSLLMAKDTEVVDDHVPLAMNHAWRLLQLHTLTLAQPVQPPRAAEQPADANTAATAKNDNTQPAADNNTNTTNQQPTQQQGQQQQGSGGGEEGQGAQGGDQRVSVGVSVAPQAVTATAAVAVCSGYEVGLAAAQIAAITQDPSFMKAIEEAVELLTWRADPGQLLRRHAGLQAIVHAPVELLACVTLALQAKHTAPLSAAALQCLHWLADINQLGSTGATAALGPAPCGDSVSWRLAMQITHAISDYLRRSLQPLTLPHMGHVTKYPPTNPTTAYTSTPTTNTTPEQTYECVVGQVLPLCVALCEVGEVHVVPGRVLVPVESVRAAVYGTLEAVLKNIASEVTEGAGDSGAMGSTTVTNAANSTSWRPQAALARVRWVLRVAAHLQPLLGPDLQSDLQALLFVGSDAAGSAGNSKAHGGLKQTGSEAAVEGGVGVEEGALLSPAPALLPYLQAVSHWIGTHVLSDATSSGCRYSPTLRAFVAPVPGTHTLHTPDTTTATPNTNTAGLPPKQPPKFSKLREAQSLPVHAVASLASVGAYTGTLGTGGLGGAAGAVVVSEWQVVLSVGEVTALLELGGPAAIDTLTATCGVLIERELAAVQTHLQSRQTSLARLMQMVGGAAAAGGDVRGAQQLQAQVSSLVHAKQGLYSAWEMAKVQASVQQLARCLAFRCSMLACALDEAAKAHMFTWAETLRHFNLPSTVAPPPPITAVTLTQSERELSEALGEMVMCEGGVEWSEMVRPVQTVGKGSREGEGVGGGGAEGSGMDTGLHYNDLWKVARPAGPAQWGPAPVDSLLARLLSGSVSSPDACACWVLLPGLLALLSEAANKSSGAHSADVSQLRPGVEDAHLFVLRYVTSAWQAAVTQALHSPAALDAVLPVYESQAQYKTIKTMARAARDRSQQGPQAVVPEAQSDLDLARDQEAKMLPVQSWGATFSAAIRG